MSTAPLINYFDGSGTTSQLDVVTNIYEIIITGVVDPNTVDVQININGSGFVSDPSLVNISIPNFTIPNLSSYPSGLPLSKGANIIQLRAIDLTGSVSPISTITITVVSDTEFQSVQPPPTGVQLKRNASSIELSWSNTDPTVTGFNIYASTGQGGDGSGYLLINSSIIPASTPTKTSIDEFPLSSWTYDYDEYNNNDLRISVNTVDPVSNDVVEQKSINTIPLVQSPNYRYTINVSSLSTVKTYAFLHDRNASIDNGILNNDVFSSISDEDPLFYVITSIYYDPTTGVLQESRYSPELSGAPLFLNTVIRGIRIRDQRIVSQDYINEVQKVEPTLSLIPGSTVREIHIEPFSNEIQKAYFLADFVHRAKSFQALLSIDDPNFSGISTPVSQSQYKQNLKTSLSINDDTAVQTLIDNAFESLAGNYGVIRQGLRAAQVNQTFWTLNKPSKDLIIQQGAIVNSSTNADVPRFVAKSQAVITAVNAQSFWNASKRRYEIKVQMVADSPGVIGNVSAGTLDTVVSGASGLQTINEVESDYGRDKQSNLELSENGMRALYSVDTGTFGGYTSTAINTPGVLDLKIVQSGDPEMMRDYDEVRSKHIGGKVDIYIKGLIERTISETFAFQFDIARNVRFDVIDPISLTFRARDSRLSVSNPIQEMLYNISQNFGIRNHSNYPTSSYDLTGYSIIDYRTIRLNTMIPQPDTTIDDFIEGDYRYRSNNKFTASVQPVRRLTSITGSVSGVLDAVNGYSLYKTQDPLLEGESTIASDYVVINQIDNIPSGDTILVNDEQHVLIGQFQESLNSVGINAFTVRVYSSDRSILYNGPDAFNPDYFIISGSQTSPIKIVRSTDSSIATGSTVSVDYEYDENFVITYVVNDIIQKLQSKIDKQKHITADVLVKQGIENPLSIEATVKLNENAVKSTTDLAIRNNISLLLNRKRMSQSVNQSNITSKIESATGVEYVVQPFTRLTLKNGSIRIRDNIISDYDFIASLSISNNAVYILTQKLPFATIDGGGSQTIHHGVYKDDIRMTESSSLESVGHDYDKFYIIGNNGAVIQGYSDDDTLKSLGVNESDVQSERINKTANKVVISLNYGTSPPDIPSNHTFSATYIVNNDTGSKDINTTGVEYLTPGDLTVTYKV